MSPRTRKPRRIAVGAPECATTWPARSDLDDRAGHAQALRLATLAALDLAAGLLDRLATLTDAPSAATVAAADGLDAVRDTLADGIGGGGRKSGDARSDRCLLRSIAKWPQSRARAKDKGR